MNNQIKIATLICVICVLGACSHKALKMQAVHDNFYSTLWLQTSAESKALAYQAYHMAESQLQRAINERTWTASLEQTGEYENLPPAIILDVDETVLNNAQFQAKMVIDGVLYDDQEWDRWVALQAAPALPGAVEFINFAQNLGVEVFFITNRDCRQRPADTNVCPQKFDTIENLKKVGIQTVKADNVMLKYEKSNWLSEKQTRRAQVVQTYRVLLLIGDDLGDFLPGVKKDTSINERNGLVKHYATNWGRKWITLSNPVYGSWMSILGEEKIQYFDGY